MRRILLISLAIMQLTLPWARAEVLLIVRKQAEASGNYVRICDIARVEGPRDQAREVANTILGPTPPKGQAREITRWDIENRLFEMGVAAKVSFSGNDMVRVYGNGSRIRFDDSESVELRRLDSFAETPAMRSDAPTPNPEPAAPAAKTQPAPAARPSPGTLAPGVRDLLGKTVSQYLAGRYPRPDIEVEAKILSFSREVPEGAHEIKVEEALEGQVPGKAVLRLSLRETAGSEPVSLTVSADTEVYGLALVAKRQLFKGETLDSRDVRIARTRMESGKSYLPPSPKAADGRELARNLAAGEAILASEARMTGAVKRGDIVQVVTSGPGWEIRGNGKALGAGEIGETIKIEDTGTKAKYNARVTGRGTVSVVPQDWRDRSARK